MKKIQKKKVKESKKAELVIITDDGGDIIEEKQALPIERIPETTRVKKVRQ